MAVRWDISTGADTAACGAPSELGEPDVRFGATVKRDGSTTTAKQAIHRGPDGCFIPISYGIV